MTDLFLPVRDRQTKPFRDALKRKGWKLVEIRHYAVIRTHDREVLFKGSTLDDVRTWAVRPMREGKL